MKFGISKYPHFRVGGGEFNKCPYFKGRASLIKLCTTIGF